MMAYFNWVCFGTNFFIIYSVSATDGNVSCGLLQELRNNNNNTCTCDWIVLHTLNF